MAASLRALRRETAVLARISGAQRKPDRRTEADDLRLDLAAHCAEALALTDFVGDRVAALLPALRELGPREYQLGLAIAHALGSYRRRHTDPEPAPAVLAA